MIFKYLSKRVFFCCVLTMLLCAQNLFSNEFSDKHQLKLSTEFYISNQNSLPFWLTANRNGIFTSNEISKQFIGVNFSKIKNDDIKWDLTYGGQFYANLDYESGVLPISYWAELTHKKITLSIGAKPEQIRFNGLSSTNANLLWSNNARPLPHIRVSTDGFIKLINILNISFKALYEENFLFDNRYVDNPMVHHKYFFLKYENAKGWSITVGLDHLVFWGGTSPSKGKLPGFENYIDYIFARQGDENSPVEDQLNISGNQMGNYIFEVHKEFNNANLCFYWNHFFEDGSGKSFKNFGDGLFGLAYISKKKDRPIRGVVLEYISTMNQSGSTHFIAGDNNPGMKSSYGNDNYFNNVIYKSGYVHHNRMIGIPFFQASIDENGISEGFLSNRMRAVHLGMDGFFNNKIKWKTFFSKYHHYGTHTQAFPEGLKTFSSLIELDYATKWEGVNLKFYLSNDIGDKIKNNFAVGFAINYSILN